MAIPANVHGDRHMASPFVFFNQNTAPPFTHCFCAKFTQKQFVTMKRNWFGSWLPERSPLLRRSMQKVSVFSLGESTNNREYLGPSAGDSSTRIKPSCQVKPTIPLHQPNALHVQSPSSYTALFIGSQIQNEMAYHPLFTHGETEAGSRKVQYPRLPRRPKAEPT